MGLDVRRMDAEKICARLHFFAEYGGGGGKFARVHVKSHAGARRKDPPE